MKNLRLIPRICVWIVYTLFLIMGAFAFISVQQYIKLLSPAEQPESKEGVLEWTRTSGIRLGDYELMKVSHYNAGSSYKGDLNVNYHLRVPYPKLLLPQNSNPAIYNTASDYHARNRSEREVEAFSRKDTLTQVVYKIDSEADRYLLITVFGILILLTIGFGIYWLIILRRFILSMSGGTFFSMDNFWRIIILCIPTFLLPLIEYIAGRISVDFFETHFQSYGGMIDVTPDMTPVIFGVFLLLMAAMVYEGSKIKEENDLTI